MLQHRRPTRPRHTMDAQLGDRTLSGRVNERALLGGPQGAGEVAGHEALSRGYAEHHITGPLYVIRVVVIATRLITSRSGRHRGERVSSRPVIRVGGDIKSWPG